MRVLAIDPGYDRLGIAVVEGDPSKPILLWSDCIIPPKNTHEQRLVYIANAVADAIHTYTPEVLGIETLFFNKNITSGLKVAEARGVVLSEAGKHNLFVSECSPQQVKLAVAGSGGADKKAIECMVPKLIILPEKKRLDDELDAIAIGITVLAIGRQKQ